MRMSAHNRVIWSEGLFLQPQHFQQQERYFERYVETPLPVARSAQLGLHRDRVRARFAEHRQGRRCGAWPASFPTARRFGCRTTIRCPSRSTSDPDVRDQILYLAVPLRRAGRARRRTVRPRRTNWCGTTCASCRRATTRRAAASRRCSKSARCARGCCWRATSRRRTPASRSRTSSNAGPTGRSCSSESFIPTVLHVRAAGRLAAFTTELLGLLHQRGEALAGRVAATGRGAAAEFADFLMLQAINRYEPLLAHYARFGTSASRSSCFRSVCRRRANWRRSPRRRSGRPKFPAYRHDRLRESFDPVIAALRESLSKVLVQSAISIPIEPRKFGISVAIVTDRSLYGSGGLHPGGARRPAVRGAAAAVPGAAQDRSGGEDRATWCGCSCPGVPVHAVPVAPRQIPYHAGFAYFELDQTDRSVGPAQELRRDRDARRR